MEPAFAEKFCRRLNDGRPDSSIATISPSMIVSSRSLGKAAAIAGKRPLNRFLLRENSVTRPSCFTANARNPSSFNSYSQALPSGNFFTARHGIGSMKCASVILGVYKVGEIGPMYGATGDGSVLYPVLSHNRNMSY